MALATFGVFAVLLFSGTGNSIAYVVPTTPAHLTVRTLLTPPPAPSSFPITHFIFIIQENHAYDNFYGTYCQILGTYCAMVGNGIPNGTCVPYNPNQTALGCLKPFPFNTDTTINHQDPLHTWHSTLVAMNNWSGNVAKMNGFLLADHNHTSVMGYYNGSTIPTYWDLAEEYGLGDNFFSSVHSSSLMNHWFLEAAGGPPALVDAAPSVSGSSFWTPYYAQANTTQAIDNELIHTNLTWKFYGGVPALNWTRAKATGETYSFWDPLLAQNQTYTPTFRPHFVGRTVILQDAAANRIPNVAFVSPNVSVSDHPPVPLANGQNYILGMLQAIEHSKEWNSTAVFISWDEYGGFYDHVPPPQIDGSGLGIRVPELVISPYSRMNYIDSNFTYFESWLHLVEWRFGMSNLTARDAAANLPLDFFDINATPRAPLNGTQFKGLGSYPAPFQSLPPPARPLNFRASPSTGGVTLRWTEPKGGAPVTTYFLSCGPVGHPHRYRLMLDGATDGVVIRGLPSGSYDFALRSLADGHHSLPALISSSSVLVPVPAMITSPPASSLSTPALAQAPRYEL